MPGLISLAGIREGATGLSIVAILAGHVFCSRLTILSLLPRGDGRRNGGQTATETATRIDGHRRVATVAACFG